MSTPSSRHPTWTLSYRQRASLPGTSPLTAYLLHLIALKRSNLCISADVTTTSELLTLADEVGDFICIFKTHCDIISDFGERTVRGLRAIARRKRFLIFEDRKFADIGETVKKQYTGGPFRIARWAELTNAHILPGPAIITGLREGAEAAINSHHTVIHTEISAEPKDSAQSDSENDSDHEVQGPSNEGEEDDPISPLASPRPTQQRPRIPARTGSFDTDRLDPSSAERKLSIVSISTTISTRTETISPLPTPDVHLDSAGNPLSRIGDPPLARALILLAEMSTKGHMLTGPYTEHCVSLARDHRDFVMGFIAQHSLNKEPGDNFLTFTPGCQLPPSPLDEHDDGPASPSLVPVITGDGLGQQYNTPRKLIYDQGCDVVIVGRGIVKAEQRALEAERYRREAWDAYEQRMASSA